MNDRKKQFVRWMCVALAILMICRVPISFCLGISALFTAGYLGIPFLNLFQKMSTGITSFTFMCVPFFIIMAQIMTDGGITDRLTKFCNVLEIDRFANLHRHIVDRNLIDGADTVKI